MAEKPLSDEAKAAATAALSSVENAQYTQQPGAYNDQGYPCYPAGQAFREHGRIRTYNQPMCLTSDGLIPEQALDRLLNQQQQDYSSPYLQGGDPNSLQWQQQEQQLQLQRQQQQQQLQYQQQQQQQQLQYQQQENAIQLQQQEQQQQLQRQQQQQQTRQQYQQVVPQQVVPQQHFTPPPHQVTPPPTPPRPPEHHAPPPRVPGH